MDCRQRHQESQSFQSLAKNFAKGFAFLSLLLACSHKKTQLPAGIQEALNNPEAPAMDVSALGVQLTKLGSNDSPSLSADGKKVIFVSQKRPSHQQSQIYIYDLETLKERRLTYQDGECRDPIFLRNGQVLYASTTDELKERPKLLQKNPTPSIYPPTDLYSSELTGFEITRLTQRLGFDGFPLQRPDRPESILFSQWNGKFLEVHQMNLKSKQSIPVLAKKDRSIEFLRPSPDGKQWAWIERLPDNSTLVVVSPAGFAAEKQKILSLPKGDYKDLSWASNQKLMLSGKTLKKQYQIYNYDLTSNCLQSLLESSSDLHSPQLNLNRNEIVFVSSSNGSSQIFYKTLPTSEQCLKWENSSKD